VPTFGPIALPALVFLLLDYIGACEKEPEVVIDRGEIGLPFTNMSANGMEGYFYVQTLYNIDIGKLCFSAEDRMNERFIGKQRTSKRTRRSQIRTLTHAPIALL